MAYDNTVFEQIACIIIIIIIINDFHRDANHKQNFRDASVTDASMYRYCRIRNCDVGASLLLLLLLLPLLLH